MSRVPNLQDLSLIRNQIKKVGEDKLEFSHKFMIFSLMQILDVTEDDAIDAITDTSFLSAIKGSTGHDRGIDAVFIDEDNGPTVHLFNFKYTDKLEKLNSNFPSDEADKIVSFLAKVLSKENALKQEINQALFAKIEDIWSLFDSTSPIFVIHLCTNQFKGLTDEEGRRFSSDLSRFSDVSHHQVLGHHIIERITKRGKRHLSAKTKLIDKSYFEKSDGDVRALIANIDARDVIRIVLDDEVTRQRADWETLDFSSYDILEDAFDENVRIYLKKSSKINKAIKETATSEEGFRFFYYNNGITVTCSEFKYPKAVRSPILELKDFQIVNGCQTIHALHEALKENPECLNETDLLVRIYETKNEQLIGSISEFTNSQNPVASRDLRSNDFTQRKYEADLKNTFKFFYERKKGMFSDLPKQQVIDAEKAAQAVMAFILGKPAEAKDEKRRIFSDKYDEIFADHLTAEHLLVSYLIYKDVESKKLAARREINDQPDQYMDRVFVLHATYFILYAIASIAERMKIDITYGNIDKLKALYGEALDVVGKAAEQEKKEEGVKYQHRMFFKSGKAKSKVDYFLSPRELQMDDQEPVSLLV
ncbi:MAG: AIPR family protein [Nitrosospira multiformis]|nr:AIPR family protein [Nitrosospira multiformis]